MGSRTSAKPVKKRSSPQPEGGGSDGGPQVKRRRSAESDKENRQQNNAADSAAAAAAMMMDRVTNLPGKPPEAGVISRIYVENFMCHRRLTVDLCRNVNFIYGQNGSGKSAILAAIQICLGAGARRTNRARNLKELVRKDSTGQCAKIRVTVLNGGDDGYLQDVYGDTITVERTIALKGGYNGYKLLDHEGVEKSRSKKDLDDLLDRLNIQVENPVAILDQEEAKKFLTGKASDKYAFYMKATELDRIDRTYQATLDSMNDMIGQKARMEKNLERDQSLVKQCKEEWDKHQELDKLKEKQERLMEGFAWSCYEKAQQTLDLEMMNIQKFREKAEKKQMELTQAEEAANGPDEEETLKRASLDELIQEAQEQTQKKQDLEADLKRNQEPHKATERQLHRLQQEQRDAAKSVLSTTQRLQQKRDQIAEKAGSADAEEARRTQDLQQCEEKLAATRAEADELKQAVSNAYRAYEELEPYVEQAKQNCRAAGGKLGGVEGKIRGLENSTGGSLAVFGARCQKVKDMVDRFTRQNKFRGPVAGPIGAYLKIAPGKEQFAAIAELALGHGNLDRFIVTNDQDRKTFQQIRKDAGCQQDCGVFQLKESARYNIPGPPAPGIETIASVLTISDDLVFNCLVDSCRIDDRALAKSREESERLLLVQDNNGRYSVRGNMKAVYCLPTGDNWSVKGGSIAIVGNEKQMKATIGVDRSAALAEAKREIQVLQNDLKEFRQEEAKMEHEHTEHQKEWNVKKRAHQTNNKEMEKFLTRIESLKAEKDSATNFDTDTSDLEADVAEAQQAVDTIKDRESSLKEAMEEKAPEIQALKKQLEEVKTRNEKVLEDMKVAEDELNMYIQNMSQRAEKIEKKRDKIRQLETILAKQEAKVQDVTVETDRNLLVAKKLAFKRLLKEQREQEGADNSQDFDEGTQDPTEEELEAIETVDVGSKEPDYFQTRIARLRTKIERERERQDLSNDPPAVVYQRYIRAKNTLDGKLKQIQEIEQTHDMLYEDLKERKRRWKQFRKHIAKITTGKFDEILNMKGSCGDLDFDDKNETLELVVQKDSMDANSQQKDVKALSGGERSYATIALLLALGESLETPFRILDEFDVFLDPVTRKLTIDQLIKMAKEMSHRQFIFITPQDVSNVTPDPMLKILKMTPPQRNELAGAATQQTLDFSQRSN